ncbi:hypothetical protein COU17_02910 [Candidatus Kaiserbacteria bacterium CG10_big_fil_rev_8_21_14_0_10_49_17]|uniref:Uncharacterized protein n=1 Tax=Candidatus Kaiserbacteria bacterium CG10_big_fil_rev_8_21_14_0_10_49_17 TaxID=1974609 RepID=A0A2M6WDU9_9BACT|nr:MAG: hypothetical protein COU17_02910 [Candidatus Kaiserbacteria bacterium CG10_big_fil_rev_8_21_14_0_10_49_17]
MKKKILVVILIGVTLLIAASLRSVFIEPDIQFISFQSATLNTALTEAHAKWSKAVEKYGAGAVYELVASEYEHVSGNDWHTAGHVLGGIFYERYGIEAVGYCDSRFDLGCYHEALGRALIENGATSLADLFEKCVSNGSEKECLHAVGHGLIAREGYSEEALLKTLSLCRELHKSTELVQSCPGGAFMEYNTRLLSEKKNRDIDLFHPTYPCEMLPADSYRGICYFWLPSWWLGFFHEISEEERVKNFFHFCASAKSEKDIHACVEGIGYTTMPTKEKRNTEVCLHLPKEFQESCSFVATEGKTYNPYDEEK